MAVYSIKDLEVLTGVKAHTIRIWEKRYHFLQPKRTKTNIRYYVDDDVKIMLNAALLNRNGYKISHIAQMTPLEMKEAVLKISQKEDNTQVQSDALTLAMLELDEEKFDAVLTNKIAEIGFKETMLQVIFPFLNRLSVLWMTGSVAPVQENYIAELIRQKIYVAIDRLPRPEQELPRFALFLPEGENQELSLLFLHYLLRESGFEVINLGHNVSLDDLRTAYEIKQPDYLFTMINNGLFRQSVREYVDQLSLYFRSCEILLSGIQLSRNHIKSHKNCRIFDGLDEILGYIALIGPHAVPVSKQAQG